MSLPILKEVFCLVFIFNFSLQGILKKNAALRSLCVLLAKSFLSRPQSSHLYKEWLAGSDPQSLLAPRVMVQFLWQRKRRRGGEDKGDGRHEVCPASSGQI